MRKSILVLEYETFGYQTINTTQMNPMMDRHNWRIFIVICNHHNSLSNQINRKEIFQNIHIKLDENSGEQQQKYSKPKCEQLENDTILVRATVEMGREKKSNEYVHL